jgi:transcriptional regulator with XRE-family HTH domain
VGVLGVRGDARLEAVMTTPAAAQPETLAEVLTAARKAKGWTLRQAERATGIPNAHLSQIETGTIEHPAANLILVLCGPYDLDLLDTLRLAGHHQIADYFTAREPGKRDAARAAARVAQLEELARDMLGRFTRTDDGYRARVGQVQIGRWEHTLAGES